MPSLISSKVIQFSRKRASGVDPRLLQPTSSWCC
jgi:hypothetical protein